VTRSHAFWLDHLLVRCTRTPAVVTIDAVGFQHNTTRKVINENAEVEVKVEFDCERLQSRGALAGSTEGSAIGPSRFHCT
jgi:hypothetical protein